MGWLGSNLGFDITGEWNRVVHLCVSGVGYSVPRRTFKPYQEYALCRMVLDGTAPRTEDGSLLINRDGLMFRHVLNFLRLGRLALPDGFDEWDLLLVDAKAFELTPLVDAIEAHDKYRKREWRQALPPSVFLRWDEAADVVDLVPPLPMLSTVLTSAPTPPPAEGAPPPTGSPTRPTAQLQFQGRAVSSCDEAVSILLSSYCMAVEHWDRPAAAAAGGTKGTHTVFLSLKK
jgi:hypothetical protein